MKLLKKDEKGFTLIELLIVVAILGVLAAVVIPNVGRFIGRGETEAAKTELANVQAAVVSMMVDNRIDVLSNPKTTYTANMSEFPDSSNVTKYVLYNYGGNASINYIQTQITSQKYKVDAMGTVTQEP